MIPPPGADPVFAGALGVARAGRIVDRVLATVRAGATPGTTCGRLDQLARAALTAADARPGMLGYTDDFSDHPFPAAVAIAINDRITGSGNPDARLAPGDLVTADLVAEFRGWFADAAISFVVPGSPPGSGTAARRAFLAEAAASVTRAGIAALRPGRPWSEVVDAMALAAERVGGGGHGGDRGVAILRGFDGHAVGRTMHAPPRLPTHRLDLDRGAKVPGDGSGPVIHPGMILAIEPVVGWGDPGFVRDGWEDRTADGSDACYAEATVLVGKSRNLVLCGGS